MTRPLLTLGGIILEAFEVPPHISLGGRQQLVVHQMIGGGRIVDRLGADDSVIAWPGVFSGPDAGSRARTVDAMRAAGDTLLLTWDAFCYQVVIETLTLRYCNPWWIEYTIGCAVSADLSQPLPVQVASLAASLAADLGAAAPFADVSAALAAVSASGALVKGTAPYAAAGTALGAVSAAIGTARAASEPGLASGNLQTVVNSAGAVAQSLMAQMYLGRATANFGIAGQ